MKPAHSLIHTHAHSYHEAPKPSTHLHTNRSAARRFERLVVEQTPTARHFKTLVAKGVHVGIKKRPFSEMLCTHSLDLAPQRVEVLPPSPPFCNVSTSDRGVPGRDKKRTISEQTNSTPRPSLEHCRGGAGVAPTTGIHRLVCATEHGSYRWSFFYPAVE